MENDKRKNAHTILQKAFDEAGIADAFYCGVLLDGTDVSAFHVGRENKIEYSNVERYQRLLGMVETFKYTLIIEAHKKEGLNQVEN